MLYFLRRLWASQPRHQPSASPALAAAARAVAGDGGGGVGGGGGWRWRGTADIFRCTAGCLEGSIPHSSRLPPARRWKQKCRCELDLVTGGSQLRGESGGLERAACCSGGGAARAHGVRGQRWETPLGYGRAPAVPVTASDHRDGVKARG